MKVRNIAMIVAGAAFLIAGCSKGKKTDGQPKSITLNGAGASFPAPVYQNWTHSYSQSHEGVQVNYQSVGSGAGINQIKSSTVDFAGSDNPLTKEEQEQAGLLMFPMLTGGVVVIVNIPGVKDAELKLSKKVLSDIYLGKITMWNNAEIKSLNSQVKLPALKITVVRRADASGTSFIFTNYLSKISPAWKQNVGCGSSVKWPVGIGGQKNPGVCNNVLKINGAIGYTEYTYAVEAQIAMVQLENMTGRYVKPTVKSFSESAGNAKWDEAPGFYMVLTNQPGENSWPITGVTYILLRKDSSADVKVALKDYIDWCFETGSTAAQRLNYVPIPKNVIELIRQKGIY
ncbi:MAG: phosphate ABC transporter substrate-binding protein PstS [Lentisphaeria bacterium]